MAISQTSLGAVSKVPVGQRRYKCLGFVLPPKMGRRWRRWHPSLGLQRSPARASVPPHCQCQPGPGSDLEIFKLVMKARNRFLRTRPGCSRKTVSVSSLQVIFKFDFADRT
eukprot:3214854-Rhodomonas_salina.2